MMVSLLFNHVIISLLVSFALSSDDGAIFIGFNSPVLRSVAALGVGGVLAYGGAWTAKKGAFMALHGVVFHSCDLGSYPIFSQIYEKTLLDNQ